VRAPLSDEQPAADDSDENMTVEVVVCKVDDLVDKE